MQSPISSTDSVPARMQWSVALLLLAALGVPTSLFWDFSWENTVGVDLFWSPPHTLNYLAMTLAGVAALMSVSKRAAFSPGQIKLGTVAAPLGAWLVFWSVLAFATSVLFDRWWQSAYGLGAGIWHPPQMLKALAFFVVLLGAWLVTVEAGYPTREQAPVGSATLCFAGGLLLALINVVTISSSYPNQQHSALFYKLACATYPIVLAALASSSRGRWGATTGALIYMIVISGMVWLLPLFPAKPEVGPIYNQIDHLMPPPFPLLLLIPAIAFDLLTKKLHRPASRSAGWWLTAVLGFAFFISFLFAQWIFAEFLLKPSSDNWFFAGGGKHWPFFFKISPPARVLFWQALPGQPPDELDGSNALLALCLAIASSQLGLWLGTWMAKVKR